MKERHKESIGINARACLQLLHVSVNQDFHTLSSDQVEHVIQMADQARYQKPKNANGSRARYFYQRLQRQALLRILVLTVLLLGALTASAASVAPITAPTPIASAPQWTLVLPVLTHHFPTDRGMNDHNWGLGIERELPRHWSLLAEAYQNSLYRPTVVIGAAWMPIRLNRASLGAAAGLDLTHGYNQNPIAPLLVDGRAQIQATQRWALGVDIMPGTPVGIGLSVRYNLGKERTR
jgi:hypothetical protein